MSVLPVGWADSSLGDLLAVLRGVSYQKNEAQDKQDEGLIPLLRANNIQSSSIVLDDLVFVPVSCVSDTQQLTAGDIVIAASSGSRSVVGKAARITTTMPITFGAFCYALRVNPEVSNEFIAYFLQSPGYRKEISNLSAGININNLKREHIETFPISLPPLNEQRRIVTKLDALFEKSRSIREKLDRLPRLLANLQKSILNAAITGKLSKNFRGCEEISNWIFERAEDVCQKVQSGGTPKEGFIESAGIPFLKVYNIVNQKIDFAYRPQFVLDDVHKGSLKKSVALSGDVLMNIVGPPLGKVAIVTDDYPEWNINQAITLFRPSERVTTEWLYLFLCSGTPIQDVIHETKGIVGQVNISLSQCRAFMIPIPPIEEQIYIQKVALELLRGLDVLAKKVTDLQARISTFESAALGKAFRGELVPQDPNDEPASVLLERIRAQKPESGTKRGRGRKAAA